MRPKSYHVNDCCETCEHSDYGHSWGDAIMVCMFAKSEKEIELLLDDDVNVDNDDMIDPFGTCEKWEKEKF